MKKIAAKLALFGLIGISVVLMILYTGSQEAEQVQEKEIEISQRDFELPSDHEIIEEKPIDHDYIAIDQEGMTIEHRISVPDGFIRTEQGDTSFGQYLRTLPLKPHGEDVRYFDGQIKRNNHVYAAVVDMDIGTRDLQQCADAIMRLRGEYLYGSQRYDEIMFCFTNGFEVPYKKWMEGNRIKVEGNTTNWVKRNEPSNTYEDFRKYMDIIFAYAGTISLSKELKAVSWEEMQIGDVWIEAGSPGHAVIVVDMAENPETGESVFLLAQSYMPAQDIQVLMNPMDVYLSPWYLLDLEDTLVTPEWKFGTDSLKRFDD